jgi:hypothetical protein
MNVIQAGMIGTGLIVLVLAWVIGHCLGDWVINDMFGDEYDNNSR